MLRVIKKNMDYDWQKIFKEKTDHELYSIYQGQSQLPKCTIEFAKNELESRNFDFDKIDQHKLSWKILGLINEEQDSERQTTIGNRTFNPLKFFIILQVFTLVIVFLFSFFIFKDKDYLGAIAVFSILSVMLTIIFLINNYIYIRIVIRQTKRIEEINKLNKEADEQSQIITKYPQIEDIEYRKEMELNLRKKLIFIGITLLFIFLLLINHLKS